jgi:adenylate kinase
MNILILGPQGSGKSTQAQLLALDLGLPYIAMGEILRTISLLKDSPTARIVKQKLEQGKLIPLDLASSIINKRLEQKDCQKGFVLDGFPRNRKQLTPLKIKFDKVFYIKVSDKEGIRRLLARGRQDDTPEIIAERLRIYHGETEALLETFRKDKILEEIEGERSAEEIHQDILERVRARSDKHKKQKRT